MYSTEKERAISEKKMMFVAQLHFKHIEPLLWSMKGNAGILNFVSDHFVTDNLDISQRVSLQKKEYYDIIDQLSSFGEWKMNAQMQEYVYVVACKLIKPALRYGYVDEALRLLKILQNEKLTGDRAKSTELEALAQDVLLESVSAYGERHIREGREHLKICANKIMADAIAGKYGNLKISPKSLRDAYENPETHCFVSKERIKNSQTAMKK